MLYSRPSLKASQKIGKNVLFMLIVILYLPCCQTSRKEKWTQWERVSHCDHNYSTTTLEPFKRHYVLASSLSENDCVFYTGIAKALFDQLAKAASAEATKTFVSLSIEDQLLLSLMRLHLGLLYAHLARVFNVSVTGAHNIFKHMLSVLTTIMKKVVIWLPRAVIRNSTPDSFIDNGFEKTTCIIDCSEIVLQRPKKLTPRAQTYSSYKARNTVKFLMAIAPNGYIMYVSAAYGGRASDKFITSDCGVEDYLGPGDEIMADRGFTLSPNLNVQGVKLNVPAFTRGKR